MMRLFVKTFCLLFLLFSCENSTNQSTYKAQSSGNINDVSVVIDNQLWESSVGEAIRTTIGAALYGLPQDEPQFKLRQIPSSVFSGFVKNSRLVLKVKKGIAADTKFYNDPYAAPQRMVLVSGMTNQEITEQFERNQEKIKEAFRAHEIQEKQRRTRKSLFNATAVSKQLGIDIQFPSVYRIAKQDGDFFWIRRDIKTGTVNLLLYTISYDETLTNEQLATRVIQTRDSIGKRYIHGVVDGTYLATEKTYTPYSTMTTISKTPAIMTQGIWKLKNAYMSGPFINYWIEDKRNNRFLVAEGFVFAPSVEKRAYIFELESMIHSISVK